MIAYVIQQSFDGLPTYYAPSTARRFAGGGGWEPSPENALAFARERDGQAFVDFHLPHLAGVCSVVPKEVAA